MRRTPIALAAERGSSMLAVIGLMAVAGVATLAIAGSTMNSIGVSSATRAGVQAQAAAEAGVADALVNLSQPTCTESWGTTAPDPVSAVVVSYNLNPTPAAGVADDGWTEGCPASNAVRVKIISEGDADQTGRAGNATGNSRIVEAIYAYESATAAIPATGPGTALYAYNFGTFAGSSQLDSADPAVAVPVVHVKTGNVACVDTDIVTSSIFKVDMVIEKGDLTVGGSCMFTGNVWASGAAVLNGTENIGGNLVADSATLSNSSKVLKNIWTNKITSVSGTAIVGGDVVAGEVELSGASAQIKGSAWSTGKSTVGATSPILQNLTTKQFSGTEASVKGLLTVKKSGIGPVTAAPTAPTVPDWVDIGYKPSDWSGYAVTTMNTGCDIIALQAAINEFSTRETPTKGIVDARECAGGVTMQASTTLSLPQDTVIFAQSFHIGLSGHIVASPATSARNLWLITPDEINNHHPNCNYSKLQDSTITESFIVSAPVSAMLYTPCKISMGFSAQWRGQFYAGSVSTTGSSQLHYTPIGIPGTGLATGGAPGTVATDAKLGDRISIRDLNG